MSAQNRRKSARAPVELKVDYRTIGSFITDYSGDLSQDGIFIETSLPLNVGDTVRLRLTLPGHTLPFALEGIVRWTTPPGATERTGMGVEFTALDDDVKAELASLVAAAQKS